MANDLLFSLATFKRGTFEKLLYVSLEFLDLSLTCLALLLGLNDLNPLINAAFKAPAFLLLLKIAIPVFIAWLIPRKLLWPSILFVAFVVFWDIKELATFFF
jgi:hypothetical protein